MDVCLMRRSVIYPALWQPVLTKGVPRDFALATVLVAALVIIFTSSLRLGFATFVPMWILGWFLARIDPEFFSVFLTRLRLGRTKGGEDGNIYRA